MPSLSKSELYDTLYQRCQEALDSANPCHINVIGKTVSCEHRQRHPGSNFNGLCCRGCKHLSATGCTVKALACKFWLCHTVRLKNPKLVERMEQLRDVAWNAHVPMFIRSSKEECFLHTEKEEM